MAAKAKNELKEANEARQQAESAKTQAEAEAEEAQRQADSEKTRAEAEAETARRRPKQKYYKPKQLKSKKMP